MLDPYSILGVSRDATFAEIKRTYKLLVKKYHPDLGNEESSNEKMAEINAAFDYFKEIFNCKTDDFNNTTTSSTKSHKQESAYREYTREEREKIWEDMMRKWEANKKNAYAQAGRNMRIKIAKVLEPIHKENKVFGDKIKQACSYNDLYNLCKEYSSKIEKMILSMYENAEKSHRYGMSNCYKKSFNEEMKKFVNKNINLKSVDSSSIGGIGYDDIHRILYVKFKTNSLYCYFDVDEYVYQSFLSSQSKGKYFEANIRSKYEFGIVE